MANTTSKRIAGVQRYIQDNPADAFHLGIIYGMLDAIKKDAEEQEKAYMQYLMPAVYGSQTKGTE